MSSIPQLDMSSRTYRCSQRLPASCRYRVDHVFIPASNQKEVQDFLTNCADQLENSKLETSHHPTMHLINKRRVYKPRYNASGRPTQTQRNDANSRQMQKQYYQTAKVPLPPVYNEESHNYEPIDPGASVNIFQSEYNQNNLISVPQSIRIRMYHRNEMIQSHINDDEINDTQTNYETIDNDLPIPPYEEDNVNMCEEIDEKDIDQATAYTESNNVNEDNIQDTDNGYINNENSNIENINNDNNAINEDTNIDNANDQNESNENTNNEDINIENTNDQNENIENTNEENNTENLNEVVDNNNVENTNDENVNDENATIENSNIENEDLNTNNENMECNIEAQVSNDNGE